MTRIRPKPRRRETAVAAPMIRAARDRAPAPLVPIAPLAAMTLTRRPLRRDALRAGPPRASASWLLARRDPSP